MNEVGMTRREKEKFEHDLTMLLTETMDDAVYFQKLVLASKSIARKLGDFELDFYNEDKNNT